MPGDFSRKTFQRRKHYSGVLMQQGRVLLDGDWNEQLDIQQYRIRKETNDVIGACGVPKKGDSFRIGVAANGTDLTIHPGHMWVGGLLCELENPAPTYFNQPYYPLPDSTYFTSIPTSPPGSPLSPPHPQLKDGTYIVYIDAWQREINYLDDPLIQEVALGDADTTARLQTVWQVKLLAAGNPAATCKTDLTAWNNLVAPLTGKLNVRTQPADPGSDPCLLPPRAGYRRLENQLYRVEVQKGGNRAGTTFKWSRDNASVETTIEKVQGSILTVASMGRDEVLGFANGQWVEIADEVSSLNSTPRQLSKILSIDPARLTITLSAPPAISTTGNRLKLRRWDQSTAAGADGLAATAGWLDLEDGIQVKFSEGTYRAGDYWLVPARTATGEVEWPPYEIPNLFPQEQAPRGVYHHYCKLAMLQVLGGKITVEDCRPLFPSLTEICAEDICFDNTNCLLPNASNVQEALDLLCAANDLRLHNKLLHGYGVVCGLKVKCRPIRTGVIIEKGYALDCEGNMIQVKNANGLVYDLVEEAKKAGYVDAKGNGTVCLSIAGGPNKTALISIENFVPQKFWDAVLEGTLLKDFYEGCIKNLLDFFKSQFSFPLTETVPVPVGQRRLTAMLNLFAQLINSASGPYAFISGNSKIQPDEDRLLRDFYQDLKAELASETFCAMYDGDRPFPAYNLDPGLDTIFGPALKFHNRLRLHPTGNFAYTSGTNNHVYAYNLSKQELIQVSAFPAASNIALSDIAVSARGDELYAVGLVGNDSVFAAGRISNTGLVTWGTPSSASGFKYVSLALTTAGRVFAVAKALGVFEIKGIGTAAFSSTAVRRLNTTGLFRVTDEGNPRIIAAVDAVTPTGTESASFTQVQIFPATNATGGALLIQLQGEDVQNDMTLFGANVYITGNTPAGVRILGGYNLLSGQAANNDVAINDSSIIRLATYGGDNTGTFVLLSMADRFKVARVALNRDKLELDEKFRIPVQLFPMGIVTDNKNRKGYVLNTMVNTLTAMNMPQVFHTAPSPDFTNEPPYDLATYRDGVIDAYRDVLSHLLQYLKDCFCDKFLVDCPQCDEDDKVYLGCVEVRDGKVYHICNFSKRRYVKTFRNVEYWLSTIPLLPIVREAFDRFCCTVFDPRNESTVGKP
ncbi:MAG: hypothetical protein INR73_01860 [Williamsia sp.]|nr:hypothetical protein [Williamsia sp.]